MVMPLYKKILLLSYISIASMSSAFITPALAEIENLYGLGHGQIEWLISIFLSGYVIGQLIYAPLANRFGRLYALRIGLIINFFGIIFCIVSSEILNYQLLLFGRFITALGASAGLSCTFVLINELLTVREAENLMSFAVVSFTLGIGGAVTLGGLITTYLSWMHIFIFLGLHGVIMFGLTYLFQETLTNPIKISPKNILTSYIAAAKNIDLVIFSLFLGFVSTVGYCYSAAAPLYAYTKLNLNPELYGYWNMINMLGMLGSSLLSNYLIKKHSHIKILFINGGLIIPCLISLVLLAMSSKPSVLWFFITTMFLYLFSGALFPSSAFLASNAIQDKASASSVMSFLNMCLATLSVIIMGYFPTQIIYSFIMIIVGVFTIIMICFITRYLYKQ
ncbi:MAG: MFS transporter [Legionellales bacterium]|nr:MFS transporter [Legionellales bacterium]